MKLCQQRPQFLYNLSMKREKLISISIRNIRHFYKATWLATQRETPSHTITKGAVPNGKITDYHSTIETVLHYKKGELLAPPQPRGTKIFNKPLAKPAAAAPAQPLNEAARHAKTGKTYTTMYSERIFYIDGRETARQTLDFDGNIIESSGDPFTGPAKDFYKGGMLKQKAHFNKGMMEGEVKTYDKSGRLISVENYKSGLKEGKAVAYNFSNGFVAEQRFTYRKGRLEGPRNAYNMAGTLVGVETFKNGRLEGAREIFYSTGKIYSRVNYEDDLMHGPRITYYENGDIMYKENFDRGKLQGQRAGFYPGGKIYLQENYNNNLLEGARAVYGEDGALKQKQFYINGVLRD